MLYTILKENLIYLLKTVRFLQGCYVRYVVKYTIYHFLYVTLPTKILELHTTQTRSLHTTGP